MIDLYYGDIYKQILLHGNCKVEQGYLNNCFAKVVAISSNTIPAGTVLVYAESLMFQLKEDYNLTNINFMKMKVLEGSIVALPDKTTLAFVFIHSGNELDVAKCRFPYFHEINMYSSMKGI